VGSCEHSDEPSHGIKGGWKYILQGIQADASGKTFSLTITMYLSVNTQCDYKWQIFLYLLVSC